MSETQEEREPLTIAVEAKDLSVGDWIVPHGIVEKVENNGFMVVMFKDDCQIYEQDQPVTVRLEDHGETM